MIRQALKQPLATIEFRLALLASVFWLGLALHGATRLAPTMDEVPHIGAGIAMWHFRDFRMNPEHPPLVKLLATIPVVLMEAFDLEVETPGGVELVSWADGNQWLWGYYCLYQSGANPQRVVFLARLVPIAIGLAGGWLAWMWAREFGGRRGALLALILTLFLPEYLGHARYVTFDVPVEVSAAAISLLAWRWWKRPTNGRTAAVVVACGILSLVKLPVAVFAVFCGLVALGLIGLRKISRQSATGWAPAAPRLTIAKWLVACMALAVLAFALQWVAAGFRFKLNSEHGRLAIPNEYAQVVENSDAMVHRLTGWLAEKHAVPETTIAMLNHLQSIHGRLAFLHGKYSRDGFLSYFFFTILYKTPLMYLIWLTPIGIVIRRGVQRHHWQFRAERLAMLMLPFLGLFALQIASRLNIGHRHILFIYFPWAVVMGVSMNRFISYKKVPWKGPATFIGILLFLCCWWHPNQATFFNLIAGGSPWKARNLLSDSNVDWGQDLPAVARELQERGYENVNLAYFGANKPEAWGISQFNFILPQYPYAINMPTAHQPDPHLPTVVSLGAYQSFLEYYSDLYKDREPEAICNSMVIYAPLEPGE